jgi:hypothetical protein
LTRLVLLLAFWAAASAAPAPARPAVCAETDRIVAELTRISGLKAARPVDCDAIGREQVTEFLKQRLKEAATPEEIRAEQITLKKLGLAPPEFDLAATTVDLFTEQALAFYDFKKRRLFLTGGLAAAAEEGVLVHELAHALADQNFNLERFIRQARKSDDGALARMAVMEGQATWLMSEYMARRMGQSLAGAPALVESMAAAHEGTAGQYPVFDAAPPYIRATLMFPYSAGMRFQHAVFEREGKAAFATVFRRPPVSTQQVLHPAKYFEGAAPANPRLPEFSARGYKTLSEGTLGELDHAILIEQYAGKEAAGAAAGWRGGRYKLWEERGRGRVVLGYASEWDSPEAARRFFELYRRVLEGKWGKIEIASQAPGRLAGEGDDGHFVLEVRGAAVTSLEGLERPGPQ